MLGCAFGYSLRPQIGSILPEPYGCKALRLLMFSIGVQEVVYDGYKQRHLVDRLRRMTGGHCRTGTVRPEA